MKLVTLTAAAALLYTMPAFAQTCASAPSCADLGYTNSTSDCKSGKYVKCPFDTSKVACLTLSVTCADLGYNKTSSQCTGDKLACPFDKTKFYCVQQPKIVNPAIGDLKYSVNGTPGTGWLRCDGKEYSQTTYADLYNVIGTKFCHKYTSRTDTAYATNNCSSGKFAVPDYRGFFLRGIQTNVNPSLVPGANDYYGSTALSYKGALATTSTSAYDSSVYAARPEELPEIVGVFALSADIMLYAESSDYISSALGAFGTYESTTTVRKGRDQSSKSGSKNRNINFMASRYNEIYGGTHVLPAYYNAYIYIYAGK